MKEEVITALGVLAAIAGSPQKEAVTVAKKTVVTESVRVDTLTRWHLEIEKQTRGTIIPPEYVCAKIESESSWRHRAESGTGPQGLGQHSQYAQGKLNMQDPFDPIEAIKGIVDWTLEGIEETKIRPKSNEDWGEIARWYHDGLPDWKTGTRKGYIHKAKFLRHLKRYQENGLCGAKYAAKTLNTVG